MSIDIPAYASIFYLRLCTLMDHPTHAHQCHPIAPMSADGRNKLGEALGTLRMTNSKANFESPYLPKTEDVKWLIENKEQVLKHWNEIYAEVNK